jgi:uroporphyrin-3 C-methyltransferase
LRELEQSRNEWRSEADALAARVESMHRQLETLRSDSRALDDRLKNLTQTHRVMRDELLAATERAASIEDAVARLSDERMRGDLMLRLNEVESLLLAGGQRLRLAQDLDGAKLAYALAAQVLDSVEDPLYASLREPLASERALLDSVSTDPVNEIRHRLQQVLAQLEPLPLRDRGGSDAAVLGGETWLGQALSKVLTVRRLDAASLRVPRDAQPAARLLLTQQIERAITAAERRDEATFRDALAAAAALADALFDPADSGVQAVIVELDTLSQQGLAWQLPSLGASLTELRALRGARQVLQSTLSPPTATSADAEVVPTAVRTPDADSNGAAGASPAPPAELSVEAEVPAGGEQ